MAARAQATPARALFQFKIANQAAESRSLLELRERMAIENDIAREHLRSDLDPLRVAAAGASRLLGLERELAARRHEAEADLGRTEKRIAKAIQELAVEGAKGSTSTSSAEPARALAEALTAFRESERHLLAHVRAQAESDAARLAGAVEGAGASAALREAHAWHRERVIDLAAREGVPATEAAPGGGPARSPADRIEEDLRRRVEDAREAARAGTFTAPSATTADDPHLTYLFAAHARDVNHGRAEAALRVEPGEARERLRDAAERIALGDLSPDALRRAASATLEARPEVTLAPSRELPRAPEALIERYTALRNVLREEAGAIVDTAGAASESTLERVFMRASEMVRLHQRIETLERKQLDLPEPPAGLAPGSVPHGVAWLSLAMSKGLEPAQAAAHLANATRATFLAVGSASARVAGSLARSAAHLAVSATLDHVRRVMHS